MPTNELKEIQSVAEAFNVKLRLITFERIDDFDNALSANEQRTFSTRLSWCPLVSRRCVGRKSPDSL
jgi:hypothetical protein